MGVCRCFCILRSSSVAIITFRIWTISCTDERDRMSQAGWLARTGGGVALQAEVIQHNLSQLHPVYLSAFDLG